MTLPLWAIIGLTLLATLGIYKTVQVWRRDMELLGRMAHIQRLIDDVCALEAELDETIIKLKEKEDNLKWIVKDRDAIIGELVSFKRVKVEKHGDSIVVVDNFKEGAGE